jgi:hypothetical protein
MQAAGELCTAKRHAQNRGRDDGVRDHGRDPFGRNARSSGRCGAALYVATAAVFVALEIVRVIWMLWHGGSAGGT